MMAPRPRTTRRAFTLMELLVVLGLIAIAVGITVPALDALQRSGRGGAAANSISVAVNAARIYNHRMDVGDFDDAAGGSPDAKYSGTAALFTPAGEIRLVVNDGSAQFAVDPDGNYIEEIGAGVAFNDIEAIDYIRLPNSARLVGVRYDGDGDLEVLPPPFAVRFNEYGNVTTDHDYIYYNVGHHPSYPGEDRAFFDPDFGRPADYNPDDWNRTTAGTLNDGRRKLPFDRIEVVSAVVAFNTREFHNYQHTVFAQPGIDDDEYDTVYEYLGEHLPEAYMLPGDRQAIEDYPAGEQPIVRAVRRLGENSTPINFSPLTGLSIRASQR